MRNVLPVLCVHLMLLALLRPLWSIGAGGLGGLAHFAAKVSVNNIAHVTCLPHMCACVCGVCLHRCVCTFVHVFAHLARVPGVYHAYL